MGCVMWFVLILLSLLGAKVLVLILGMFSSLRVMSIMESLARLCYRASGRIVWSLGSA